MPFSVISKARKPVPQNRPTPMHITVVAMSDAYGVLPRQSSQSHITATGTTFQTVMMSLLARYNTTE